MMDIPSQDISESNCVTRVTETLTYYKLSPQWCLVLTNTYLHSACYKPTKISRICSCQYYHQSDGLRRNIHALSLHIVYLFPSPYINAKIYI